MKKNIIILLVILGLIVISGNGCITTEKKESFEHPKISLELQEKLETTSLERVHIYAIFKHGLSYSEKEEALKELNITIVGCFNGNCTISLWKNKTLDLVENENVVQLTEIPLKWRLDPLIIEDNIPSYAITEERSLKIWVRFYDDIPPEEMERIVTKYGKFVTELEKGTLQDIEVPKENIIDLVNEDGVRTVSLRGASYTAFGNETV